MVYRRWGGDAVAVVFEMQIVVSRPEDIDTLRSYHSRYAVHSVAIDQRFKAQIDADFAKSNLRQINDNLKPCGCVMAAIFLVSAVVVLTLQWFYPTRFVPTDPKYFWLWAFGLMCAASLCGKLVGLLIAELKLRAAMRDLRRQLVNVQELRATSM